MRENIVLIGMSGAGKSTLGVLLAKALGLDFLDTDILLQRSSGLLLPALLEREGTEGFLRREAEIVAGLEAEGCVVATGGSVVYSPQAMAALRRGGRIVYLSVPFDELAARLKDISTRGVVFRRGGSLREVYDERLPLYARYADLTIDESGKSIEACVAELAARL